MRWLLCIAILLLSGVAPAATELPEVLTLEAAIQKGLSSNYNMRSQQYRVASAKLDMEVAERVLKPQIRSFATSDARSGAELGSRYGLVMDKQMASGSSVGVGYYNSSFGDKHLSELRFSYRLPFFGNKGERIRNDLADASFSLQHEQNLTHLAEIELHQEISNRFFGVVLAKEQLRLARRLLELSQLRLEEARIRRAGEQASDLEVTRARISNIRASRQFDRMQGQLHEAQSTLRMAMGVAPDEHFVVDEAIQTPGQGGLADVPLPDLVEMAYERRLDFALSRHEMTRLERSINMERKSMFPNVEVSLQYSLVSEDDTFGGAHNFNDKRFGISVKMDTDFSRTGKSAEQRRKLLEYSRRRENFQRTLDLARMDIRRAQTAVKSARGEIELAQEMIALAQQEHQRGLILAHGGEMDRIDVFDLDRRVDEARYQHRAAQISLMNADYSLRLLVGGVDVES